MKLNLALIISVLAALLVTAFASPTSSRERRQNDVPDCIAGDCSSAPTGSTFSDCSSSIPIAVFYSSIEADYLPLAATCYSECYAKETADGDNKNGICVSERARCVLFRCHLLTKGISERLAITIQGIWGTPVHMAAIAEQTLSMTT